jgi:hypothetical protein
MADAIGGTITYSGGKTIHTFTGNGTFAIPGPAGLPKNVEVLVVSGGGGGGGRIGGGGGGGGVDYDASLALSSYSYSVVVGAGGAAGASDGTGAGGQGGASSFSTLSATGGGYGGYHTNSAGNGGSGGGETGYGNYGHGTGIGGEGYAGGQFVSQYGGAGGGGAGAVGGNGATATGGTGGTGVQYSISGSALWYAGGGGGASYAAGTTPGVGGSGVGATGAASAGSPATTPTANRGGGGGGGDTGSGVGAGTPTALTSAGAAGVVIISYTTDQFDDGNPLADTAFFSNANLQGYWKFDSGADTADSSSNSNTLTHVNTPSNGAGKFDEAETYLNSSSEYSYKASPTGLGGTGSFTITGWVKNTSKLGAFTDIMSLDKLSSRAFQLGIQGGSTGNPQFNVRGLTNTGVIHGTALTNGAWTFVAARYDVDEDTIAVWFNDDKDEEATTGTRDTSTANLAIGCDYTGGGDAAANFIDAAIDDLAYFDTALSDQDIDDIFNGVLAPESSRRYYAPGIWR